MIITTLKFASNMSPETPPLPSPWKLFHGEFSYKQNKATNNFKITWYVMESGHYLVKTITQVHVRTNNVVC